MAIFKGMLRKMSGSAGDLTFKTVDSRTIVSEKPTTVKDRRTGAQLKVRMKWSNMIQTYKLIAPLLDNAFENKAAGVSDYNMYVKVNSQRIAVYLSKSLVAGGACVAAPYQISQGSLRSIKTNGNGAYAVTNIELGGLEINSETSISEFANAVVQNNDGYNYGDQISFFSILQEVDEETGVPYCTCTADAVVLSKSQKAKLLATVSKTGFTSVDGFLGHGENEGDGVYCWVHSRKKNHKTLISSQTLINNNPLLDQYTSQEAYELAANSYGGSKETFLTPNSSESDDSDEDTGGTSSSGGTSSGGSSSGGTSSGGTSSGGTTSGGDSTGEDGDSAGV